MSIWYRTPSLEEINGWHRATLPEALAITITELGDNYLKAQMPITNNTVQPFRTMHGGASAALAETIGSVAAQLTVNLDVNRCVGLTLNINHIRTIPIGQTAYATARPNHIGKSTQVWNIEIHTEQGKLASTATLTMAILAVSGQPVSP